MDTIIHNGLWNDNERLNGIANAVADHLLGKYLPESGVIVDCGKGCFGLGEKRTVEHIADLTALDDESVDAVVSFGTVILQKTRVERAIFVREAMRVLKTDGVFIFDFISPEAITFAKYLKCMRASTAVEYRELSTVDMVGAMGDCCGLTMEEMAAMARNNSMDVVCLASLCQMAPELAGDLDRMSEEEYADYIRRNVEVCEDPFVARYAMRGAFIGQKKPYDEFA